MSAYLLYFAKKNNIDKKPFT